MKTLSSILTLLTISGFTFSQSWGITDPPASGGYDVQYISELQTTYASGGGDIVTLSHDTVTSSITGPSINKFKYFSGTLYAATNGSNSFRFLDTTWKVVPNVLLDSRSFYLDTIGSNILILSESSQPYPGHVLQYDGNYVSTIPGLDVYWTCDLSVTYQGKKFIAFVSPSFDSHLLVWNGHESIVADIPDNYCIANLFVSNSKLYATILLLGIYQLWEFDGSAWHYVLQFPSNFSCLGAFNDDDQAVYFFGSDILKCLLPDTFLLKIENPITNSIYAMTKDTQTNIFYFSSNYIFWWDGNTSLPTESSTMKPLSPALFRYDMPTKTLFVDYQGEWLVFNSAGQIVIQGNGIMSKNIGYLAPGIYIISPKDMKWTNNKFVITH